MAPRDAKDTAKIVKINEWIHPEIKLNPMMQRVIVLSCINIKISRRLLSNSCLLSSRSSKDREFRRTRRNYIKGIFSNFELQTDWMFRPTLP